MHVLARHHSNIGPPPSRHWRFVLRHLSPAGSSELTSWRRVSAQGVLSRRPQSRFWRTPRLQGSRIQRSEIRGQRSDARKAAFSRLNLGSGILPAGMPWAEFNLSGLARGTPLEALAVKTFTLVSSFSNVKAPVASDKNQAASEGRANPTCGLLQRDAGKPFSVHLDQLGWAPPSGRPRLGAPLASR